MRLALAFSLVSVAALASSGGITGYSGKSSATCNDCHNGGAAPLVTLSGPSMLNTGQVGDYTVTITGGAGKKAGLDVSASSAAAVLTSGGTTTRVQNGEVTHTGPLAFANGSATFAFHMMAPSTAGSVTLKAAGLSADGNNTTSGDAAMVSALAVTVVDGAGGGGGSAADAGTGGGGGGGSGGGGGASGPPPTPAPQSVVTPPVARSGGLVEGDVGCSSTGAMPKALLLGVVAFVVLLRARRRDTNPLSPDGERDRVRGRPS